MKVRVIICPLAGYIFTKYSYAGLHTSNWRPRSSGDGADTPRLLGILLYCSA
jgi:hypothetical protein